MTHQHAQDTESSSRSASASRKRRSQNIIPNNVVAGYVAGISGTLVGHPMDSLKVWMQTNRTMANQQQLFLSSNSSSITKPTPAPATTAAATAIVKSTASSSTTMAPRLPVEKIPASASTTPTRAMSTLAMSSQTATTTVMSRTRLLQCRLRALYAGMSGPLFTVGLVQSINFGTYDTTRRILYYGSAWNNNDHANNNNKTDDYLHNDSLRNVAISSMTAGAVLACFTSPMMIIKTKQQLQGMSFRQAAREVLLGTTATTTAAASSSSSSIFQRTGMYTGFAPHFACETIGRGIYMCTYEALKRHLATRQSGDDDDDDKEEAEGSSNKKISLSIRMVSAACAGIAGNAVVYPMDVIRCRFYAQTNVPVEQRSKNMRQLIQTIYHQERRGGSMRGFYRGFGVTLLRAGPVAAAVLPIYDITLETLNDGQYCIF